MIKTFKLSIKKGRTMTNKAKLKTSSKVQRNKNESLKDFHIVKTMCKELGVTQLKSSLYKGKKLEDLPYLGDFRCM